MLQTPTFGIFKEVSSKLKDPSYNDITVAIDTHSYRVNPGVLFNELPDVILQQIKSDANCQWQTTNQSKTVEDVVQLLCHFKYRKYTRLACFHLKLHIIWQNNKRFIIALAKRPFDDDYGLPTISKLQELLYLKVSKEFYLLPSHNIPPSFLEAILKMTSEKDFKNEIIVHFNIQCTNKQEVIQAIVEWIYLPISKSITFDLCHDLLLHINPDTLLPFPVDKMNSFDEHFHTLHSLYLLELCKVQQEISTLIQLINPRFMETQIVVDAWHYLIAPISSYSISKNSYSFLNIKTININIHTTMMSPRMKNIYHKLAINDSMILLTFGSNKNHPLTFAALATIKSISKILNGTEIVFQVTYNSNNHVDRLDAIYCGGGALHKVIHALQSLPSIATPQIKSFFLEYCQQLNYQQLSLNDTNINQLPPLQLTSVCTSDLHEFLIKHHQANATAKIVYMSSDHNALHQLFSMLSNTTAVVPLYANNPHVVAMQINQTILTLRETCLQICVLLNLNKSHCKDLSSCLTLLKYHVTGFIKVATQQTLMATIKEEDALLLQQLMAFQVDALIKKIQLYEPLDLHHPSDEQKYEYYIKYCGSIYITPPHLQPQPQHAAPTLLIIDACQTMGELAFIMAICNYYDTSSKTRVILNCTNKQDVQQQQEHQDSSDCIMTRILKMD